MGWLHHEGVLRPGHLAAVRYCTDDDLRPEQEFNVVTVELTEAPDRLPASRLISSACGVCGTDAVGEVLQLARASAADLREREHALSLDPALISALPEVLRAAQPGYGRTGGLHAAGLFLPTGDPVVVREDVGRHNAVDKVVGATVYAGHPMPPILVLSGRIGFELVQKATMSGIPVVLAVGAPSSLARDLAEQAGLTLIGFVREDRFVIYTGADRIGV